MPHFPPRHRALRMGLAAAIIAAACPLLARPAPAQSLPYTAGSHDALPGDMPAQDHAGHDGVQHMGPGEHYTAHGKHTLPPGYQDTPSSDINHGPDPDHLANVQRDPVTGADLSKFGSAYSNSSPTQQGSLGDASGNGWVAPH